MEVTGTTGGPVLEVGGLSKRYRDGTWANRDISFEVEPGELLGILGPNGAGKTTLVRQITTELIPTSGTVRVLGRDAVSDPDSVKPMLGVVPQEANLYWGLTVFHHLRLFGRLRGLSRRDARARADHVIESLRLHEHRDRPIEALSGGLKRRVIVGIAALTRPSRYHPMACFSEVASAWKSTKMNLGESPVFRSSRMRSTVRKGQSRVFMKTRPIRLITAVSAILMYPLPGLSLG